MTRVMDLAQKWMQKCENTVQESVAVEQLLDSM